MKQITSGWYARIVKATLVLKNYSQMMKKVQLNALCATAIHLENATLMVSILKKVF